MLFVMKRLIDPDMRLLQAAADPTRLAILRQLCNATSVCACDFTSCCGVAQPTISHHLKVLREAGWVTGERRGNWVYYSLRTAAVARFNALAGDLRSSLAGGGRSVEGLTGGEGLTDGRPAESSLHGRVPAPGNPIVLR
jgi:ArsR family transcriptional regulator, arsenate/arsenite/antimonite-responsive transcriptional repressor